MGNCCSHQPAKDAGTERKRLTARPSADTDSKEERKPSGKPEDVPEEEKEEEKEEEAKTPEKPLVEAAKKPSPPPQPEKKKAQQQPRARKKSIPKQEPAERKETVYSDYVLRPQKRHPDWDPSLPDSDTRETDLTDGKQLCFLIYKKDRSKLALFNNTDDVQVQISMQFPGNVLEPSREAAEAMEVKLPTVDADGWFTTTLFPGETAPFAHGVGEHTWTGGYSMKRTTGPIRDVAYMAKVAARLSAQRENDTKLMNDIAKEKGLVAGGIPPATSKDYSAATGCALADSLLTHPNRSDTSQFVDITFPPEESSILVAGRPKCWVKPSDYLPEGVKGALFVKGTDEGAVTPGDIDQGILGDCWFMAAIAACAEFPNDLVLPLFKEAEEAERYSAANVYHVRLAKNGWFDWHVCDGYLPCNAVPSPDGPCFARNKEQPNELWVSLLEKVYAKLHGSYNNIAMGDPAVALSDLTGYPSRPIPLEQSEEDLFRILQYHDDQQHCIFVTSPGLDITHNNQGTSAEKAKAKAYAEMGLVSGHAYTLLQVYEWHKSPTEVFRIAKIRNPWGTGKEWSGSFRDTDPVWEGTDEAHERLRNATHKDREATGHIEDGTWWMELKDIQRMFGYCGACFVNLDWWEARIKTGLKDTNPVHIIEMTPERDCDALAWVTQTDKRGLPEGDPREKYTAMRLQVLQPEAGEETMKTVAVSGGNAFTYGHSLVAFEHGVECDFDGYFRLEAGETYYLVWRGHPHEELPCARTRDDLVVALMTSEPCNMRVLEPTADTLESFNYAGCHGFNVDGCRDVSTEVKAQVNHAISGPPVPWNDIASYSVKPQRWCKSPGKSPTHRKSIV